MLNELYVKIGPAGFVLVLAGLICFYLSVKNYIYLYLLGNNFDKIMKNMKNDHNIESNLANPMIAILNDIVKTHANHSDDIKSEIAFLFNHYFRKTIRDITIIRIIAVISPLIGLLGTVLGLLQVFGSLAQSSNSDTQLLLASGLYSAIYTTVLGLSIAIPALVIFNLLALKMHYYNIKTVEYCYRVLGHTHYCESKCDVNYMKKLKSDV